MTKIKLNPIFTLSFYALNIIISLIIKNMGNCMCNMDIVMKNTKVLPILQDDSTNQSVISSVQIKNMPGDKLLSKLKIRHYFDVV